MPLRLLSYNIHKARAFFSRKKTWHLLHSLFDRVKPDIIFLQEFLIEPETEGFMEKLADSLWPYHSFGKNSATSRNFNYGNVILSRYPLQTTHNTDISNHALESRGLLYGRIEPSPGKSLHLYCCHLDLTELGRKRQLQRMHAEIEKHTPKNEPLLLAGDFNDWQAKLHKSIESTLLVSEAFAAVNGKLANTAPSLYPMLPLDRVYSRHLEPINAHRYRNLSLKYGSDHLPLLVEFKL